MKQIDNSDHTHQVDASADLDETNPISTLKEGLAYEVNDIVKLELTAEQMLHNEAQLVIDYVADDAKHFWTDLKEGLLDLEATTGEMLLSVADPTSVEWQQGQWLNNQAFLQHQIK